MTERPALYDAPTTTLRVVPLPRKRGRTKNGYWSRWIAR